MRTFASLSATSQQFGFVVNATETPQASAAPDGAVSQTTVISAPHIDDATTAVDQYLYSARLDDRHIVTVTSFTGPSDSKAASEEAQRLLTDSVHSIRRRE